MFSHNLSLKLTIFYSYTEYSKMSSQSMVVAIQNRRLQRCIISNNILKKEYLLDTLEFLDMIRTNNFYNNFFIK